MYIYIYIYSFFVSLWFQEKITWSPNWWQTMILRCWLLWWLWHHPWHHADATSGSFWDKAGMGGWEYGQAVVWTKNTPKKIAHGAGCSGFLKKKTSSCFFVWRISVITSMDPNPFDGFIQFHNFLEVNHQYNHSRKLTVWDTPTMIWAVEKGNFSLKQIAIFWISIVRFHGWVLYRVSLGRHPWHLQPLDFPGDSQLSPTGTFLCPRNHLMQVLTLVAMEVWSILSWMGCDLENYMQIDTSSLWSKNT